MYGALPRRQPPMSDVKIHRRQVTSHRESTEDDDILESSNGEETSIDHHDNPNSQLGYEHNPTDYLHTAQLHDVESAGPHALYDSSDLVAPTAGGDGVPDQLTLSFQGEVFVFDSVSPEKVQAVLLLLGGYEMPNGIPTQNMAPLSQKAVGDYPSRCSQSQRAASLNRFREKRKERCFDKKIRYTVRKEVALKMQRKKGQFTSSKATSDEPGSTSGDWNGNSGEEEQETTCRQCNISSSTTPMMRRGPDGPRTLCNACGLKWANKLRVEVNGHVTARTTPPSPNLVMPAYGGGN